MALTLRSLHARFGVEVLDVDVTRVDESTFKKVAEAFDEYSVVLFRARSTASQVLDSAGNSVKASTAPRSPPARPPGLIRS